MRSEYSALTQWLPQVTTLPLPWLAPDNLDISSTAIVRLWQISKGWKLMGENEI